MEKYAVILIYEGAQISSACMDALAATLATNTVVCDNSINLHVLNEKEMLQSLISHITLSEEPQQEHTAEENAVIYIGTCFAKSIISGVTQFSIDLSSQYMVSCLHNDNKKLVEAVRIIGTGNIVNVSRNIMHKYNFSSEEWKVVKSIYNAACQGRIVDLLIQRSLLTVMLNRTIVRKSVG